MCSSAGPLWAPWSARLGRCGPNSPECAAQASRSVGADRCRAAPAAAAVDPSVVRRDRRGTVPLARHRQDARGLDLPQAQMPAPAARQSAGPGNWDCWKAGGRFPLYQAMKVGPSRGGLVIDREVRGMNQTVRFQEILCMLPITDEGFVEGQAGLGLGLAPVPAAGSQDRGASAGGGTGGDRVAGRQHGVRDHRAQDAADRVDQRALPGQDPLEEIGRPHESQQRARHRRPGHHQDRANYQRRPGRFVWTLPGGGGDMPNRGCSKCGVADRDGPVCCWRRWRGGSSARLRSVS